MNQNHGYHFPFHISETLQEKQQLVLATDLVFLQFLLRFSSCDGCERVDELRMF